jgi:hypothetical protein
MKNTLFLAFITCLLSCKHEPPPNPDQSIIDPAQWDCYLSTNFECKGIGSDYYVSGLLDDKEFCINTFGEDSMTTEKGIIVITDSPDFTTGGVVNRAASLYQICAGDKTYYSSTTDLSDKKVENKLGFIIGYQTSDQPRSFYETLTEQFVTDKPLPLSRKWVQQDTSFEGFYVELTSACSPTPIDIGSFGWHGMPFTSQGPQPDDAYLKCTKKEIVLNDVEGYADCYLTFEFSCNLYYVGKFWRRLNDGKMNVKVRIKD